ncbi:MAG: hypothetical protein LBP38_00130 [Desulfovibrio sp.]|nr:hypothetical protein [Desulfovibrio sp.]
MKLFIFILALTLFLSGCGDSKEIKRVKSGSFKNCQNKTVEQAADDFFDSPKWESGIGVDGETKGLPLVNLKGKMKIRGKEVDAVLQFILDENGQSFKAHALETNGVPQPDIVLIGLLKKMCE